MSIKSILMKRDGMNEEEADDLIYAAKEQLFSYLAEGRADLAYGVCEEFFGLEPDYLDELI